MIIDDYIDFLNFSIFSGTVRYFFPNFPYNKWSLASLVVQVVKYLPAMPETRVWSLGWEDPLEKGMAATHSSILAWKTPWAEEAGKLQFMGLQRVGHNWATNTSNICRYLPTSLAPLVVQ